jgi:hypothetical protein
MELGKGGRRSDLSFFKYRKGAYPSQRKNPAICSLQA